MLARRLRLWNVFVAAIVGLLLHAPAQADTTTALGDRSGEGSTPFTGLAQSPEANPLTGAMGTRVPINVPPGRKNVTPKLALEYSSTAGPSPYGFGWDLPLGRIQRSTKWGVPRCTGAHTDDFVLAMPGGTAELIAESPGSDFYRPKVQETYVRAQKFATGSSNSWVVYDRSGLKYVFGDQVAARTGTDTGQFLGVAADGSCAFTTSWALTHVEDPNGNAMDVTYTNVGNVPYPASVDYGGNTHGPAHLYHVLFAKPDGSWGYEERPDAIESYLSGARTVLQYRLTSITVTTDIPTPNTFIRSYTLSYDDPRNPPAGYQSRLSSVQTTGYPPTSFTYADSTAGLQAGPPQTPPVGVGGLRYTDSSGEVWQTVLDMDGDGFSDLVVAGNGGYWTVYRGTANGWSATPTRWFTDSESNPHSSPPVPPPAAGSDRIRDVSLGPVGDVIGWSRTGLDTFDINGDGIPDLVDAHTTPWMVYLGKTINPERNNSGIGYFQLGRPWSAPVEFTRRQYHYEADYGGAYGHIDDNTTYQDVFDINGDGLPDLVIADINLDTGYPVWRVYFNTGVGFSQTAASFPAPVSSLGQSGDLSHQGGGGGQDLFVISDFNGDGLPDLIGEFTDAWRYWAYAGCSGLCTWACGCSPYPPCDPSLCGVPPEDQRDTRCATGHCLDVYLNTGEGFATTPLIVPVPKGPFIRQWDSDNKVFQDLVDVNGDGLPDYVELAPSGQWQVALNQGGQFEPFYDATTNTSTLRSWPNAFGAIRKSSVGSSTRDQIDLIDVNGDGLLDRVDTTASPWTVQLNANPVRPNLLVKVENGLGGTTLVGYIPSTVYDNLGNDGTPTLPFVTWTTASISREDGLCSSSNSLCIATGDALLTLFWYDGGLFDRATREFRGFRDVFTRAADNNETQTVFLQDDVQKGKVLSTSTFAGSSAAGQLIRVESNTWNSAPLDGTQSTQLWLQKHDTWQYDLDSPSSAAYAVEGNDKPDRYGNVLHTYRSGVGAALQVDTWAEYAQSAGSVVHDKPAHTWTVDYGGRRFGEKWFFYDNSSYGQLTQGNVTRVESWLDHSNAGSAPPCTVNTSQQCVSTQMGYDVFGNMVGVIDANSNPTSTTYDDGNHVFLYPYQVTDASGHTTTTETDYRWGKPSSVTDPNLATTSYSYDEAGRPACVIRPQSDPDNPDTSCSEQYVYTYATALGQLSSVAVRRREPNQTAASPDTGFPDQLAGYLTATAFFDGLGRRHHAATMRVVGSVDQEVIGDWTEYDAVGRVARRADPYISASGDPANPDPPNNGWTTYDYHLNGSAWNDPLGRVHTVTKVDGTTRTTLYDGAVRTDIDEEQHRTTTTLDALGRVAHVDVYNPSGSVYATTAYTYDGAGRVLTTKQNGNIYTQISITYDSLGRKLQMTDPDSGTWYYSYDAAGNLIYQDDPQPLQHTEYCYDALNRLSYKTYYANDDYTRVRCATVSTAVQERYFYDEGTNGVGRLTHVTDPSGSTAFTYDARGRIRSTTKSITAANVSTAATTDYHYDAGDHVTQTSYLDNEIVTTAYDHSGQPVSLANSTTANSTTYVSAAQYDLFGRLTSLTHGNGVTDTYAYYGQPGDADFAQGHRLERILTQRPTQTSELSFPGFSRPAYAAGGGGGTVSYQQLYYASYTPRGLLTELHDYRFPSGKLSDSATFSYDLIGRLIGADGPNLPYAATQDCSNGYCYDALGNMTAKEGVQYTYDTAHPHRLAQVNGNAISYDANGNRTAKPGQNYRYDANDRLSAINDGAVQFVYDYNGQRVAKVVEASGVLRVARYYSALAEVEDGILTKYYFFGGQRVASRRATAPSGLAALPRDPAVQLAGVRPEHLGLIVLLRRDVQFAVAASATALAAGLLLAPWRRKRVVGIAVRHGHVVGVVILLSMASLPIPLIVAPAAAGGGGGGGWGTTPTPTATPVGMSTTSFALGVCCDDRDGTMNCGSTYCGDDSACSNGQVCSGSADSDWYTEGNSGTYPPAYSACHEPAYGALLLLGKSWWGAPFNGYYVRNLVVKWHTGGHIPANATISSAYVSAYVNSNSVFNANSRQIAAGYVNWDSPMAGCDGSDYTTGVDSNAISGTPIASLAAGQTNAFFLNNVNNISRTGNTYLRWDVSGGAPTGPNEIQVAARGWTAHAGMRLTVSYTVPTPAPTATPYPTATIGPPVEAGIHHYHYNHLGSVQVVTDANGAAVEYIRYKPYGEVRGHYDSSGTLEAVNTCADDQYCHEFTGYDTEPISGLQYAGARFYDPALGMFLTHDPKRQFANPYAYGPWDPVNGTDPNGAFFLVDDLIELAFILVAASAVAVGIDTGIRTGDPLAGFDAAMMTGVTGTMMVEMAVVAAPTIGTLPGIAQGAIALAGVGASGYGTYESFQHGYYASGVVGIVATAFAATVAYDAYENGQFGAQPARPQGASVTSSKQQPGEPSLSELDVRSGDVLATDEGVYAKTIGTLDPTGDFGHTQLAVERQGGNLAVLTSDAGGQRVADVGDSALSGRGYTVFRARVEPQVGSELNGGGIWGWIKANATGGGLGRYLGNWGGNVCSATCNSALVAGGINTGIAPNTFVTPNGLVSNPALVRFGRLPYVP